MLAATRRVVTSTPASRGSAAISSPASTDRNSSFPTPQTQEIHFLHFRVQGENGSADMPLVTLDEGCEEVRSQPALRLRIKLADLGQHAGVSHVATVQAIDEFAVLIC